MGICFSGERVAGLTDELGDLRGLLNLRDSMILSNKDTNSAYQSLKKRVFVPWSPRCGREVCMPCRIIYTHIDCEYLLFK